MDYQAVFLNTAWLVFGLWHRTLISPPVSVHITKTLFHPIFNLKPFNPRKFLKSITAPRDVSPAHNHVSIHALAAQTIVG